MISLGTGCSLFNLMTIVLVILPLIIGKYPPNITPSENKKALPELSSTAFLISILLPDKSTVFILVFYLLTVH